MIVDAFLRNNKGNQNNWISLNLEGTTTNRDGIGARVKITSGGKVQTCPEKKHYRISFTE